MPQINTAEAILAVAAVDQEKTVTAVFGVEAALQIKTPRAVRAVVTKLRLNRQRIFYAVSGSPDAFPVHAVFGMGHAESQITIFVIRGIIAVLTVLRPYIVDGGIAGYCFVKFK
jgi:hypothetical protein